MKKSYGRKRYPKKGASSKKYIAKVATQVVLRNQEKKYLDTVMQDNFPLGITNNAQFVDLTIIAQSTTTASDTTRVGDKIRLIELMWNIQFEFDPASADLNSAVRMIIFQWKPNNNIYDPSSSILTLLNYDDYSSPLNHDNGNQFRVLYDKTHVVCKNGQSTVMETKRRSFVNKTKSTKYISQNCDYIAGTGKGANHLYLMLISDDPFATSFTGIHGYARVVWTDS